jgi:nicotinamide-nucleotide amidase
MSHEINAEVIAIGTEILLGEITDTNSVYIARLLRDYGINLYYMTSVGDNRKRIADAIRLAMSRAQLVITCGGLGPTVDDMTRQAVADATDRTLEFQQVLLDQIAARFSTFKTRMTENNRQQAYVPAGAVVLENPVGTAPGFIVNHNGCDVISVPGVPREMKYLLTERAIPYLRQKYQLGVIKARVLKTAGIGESMLDSLIGADLLEAGNPTVGLAAHSGQVDVRITAKADTIEEALAMIDRTDAQLRERIGKHVFGVDEDKLETVLAALLEKTAQQIAIIEAGTGGGVGRALSSVNPGIIAAATSYDSPDALCRALGIVPDARLSDTAQAVMTHIQAATGAAACLVILTDPEADEGADSDERTALIAQVGDRTRTRVFGFGGQADIAPRWISMWGLSAVWGMLKERTDHD